MTAPLAVVIPAYNEARTIGLVVRNAARHADRLIVVDDGSTDGTAEQVAGIAGVQLLRHPENRGKAESLRTGIRQALEGGAAAVISLDADGQHDPEDIPRLVAAAARAPGCVIVAARREERAAAPALRRFANGFADFWISWAAGQWIADTQSGFRLYPAAALRRVLPRCARYRRFVFESLILIEAARHGHPIESVPVRTIYPADARLSHYRGTGDTLLIVRAVAWRLIRCGMAPLSLARALGWLPPAYGSRGSEPRAGGATATGERAPPPPSSRPPA